MKSPQLTPAEAALIEAGMRANGFDAQGFSLQHQPIIGGDQRIHELVAAGTRRNGKHLITPERAQAMLGDNWCLRRVSRFGSVMFQGIDWCVLGVPGVRCGDLVQCLWNGTKTTTVLMVRLDEASYSHECLPVQRDAMGFRKNAQVIGDDYAHLQATQPTAAKFCSHCGASLNHQDAPARPRASAQTTRGHQ